MATLVLTAAGMAAGGPIGGAIGAAIGQAADQAIFAGKARHGPRLGDLAVQTSTYGSQIPKLFGTIRVAGTVIWATDLVETRSSGGGGKGRPRTVNYSYSANFAVGLSARRVRAVRRIWADGKLLRGAAGDLKAAATLRFYDGDEDQPVDPLIASAEGGDAAPAFRGLAYAVFENLQLADFGNRIPSLTFEIEADSAPVTIGRIADELSGGALVAGETPSVGGYAATGDSVRSALAVLAEPLHLSLAQKEEGLVLGLPTGAAIELGEDECAASLEVRRQAAASLPAEVSLSYYDATRDYQTSTQRASRGRPSRRSDSAGLPLVLGAADAKAFAEARLAALWAARTTARVRLGWQREALRPGALVRLPGRGGVWKVCRWLLAATHVELELCRVAGGAAPIAEAAPGRAVGEPDLIHGPTTLRLLDLPLPTSAAEMSLFALAGGAEPGWRSAALLFSPDGGISWNEPGTTAEPAILGHSTTALASAGSALIDAHSTVEVALLNDSQWLESRSDAALAAGANLASLGSELIQFGSAEPLGDGRFRLGRLLRGRRGTEWAAAAHLAGEDFALLGRQTMLPLPLPAASAGATAIAVAIGIGDPPDGARAEVQVSAEALRPPTPVHLAARRAGDGALILGWVRRSRLGWDWASGGDTPLGEEKEAYAVTVSGGGVTRSFEVGESTLIYSSAEQAADGLSYPVTIAVSQLGTYAASRPAVLTFG
jgi:hypothetical protein